MAGTAKKETIFTPSWANPRKWWAYSIIGWLIWGSLLGSVTYFRILGYNPAVPFWPPFLNSIFGWAPWTLVAPLIFWLGRRFQIKKGNWKLGISAHVILSLAICATLAYYHTLVGALFYSWLNNEPYWFAWHNFGMPEFLYLRIPWLLTVYWMTLGAGYAIEYHREAGETKAREARLEALLSDTRLRALRHQLQPHFLFNTLHSVAALVNKNDPQRAIEMIERLSHLLRYAISHMDSHEVTLEEELRFLRMYVDTEKVRFSDRLQVSFHIESETKAAYAPSFILQPLVENSIRHGIERHSGEGVIDIYSCRKDNMLVLEVRDNGAPSSNGSVHVTERPGGVGLAATRSRLADLYQSQAALELLTGKTGAIARVTLPFHTKPQTIGPVSATED